jgi:hypothetical protein
MADQLNGKDMIEKSTFQVGKGGLLRGSKILNDKFIAAWNKDGFKDYLQEESSVVADSGGGGSRLLKMMTGQPAQTEEPPPPPIGKKGDGSVIKVNIEDNDYVGDERMQPAQLRRLLQTRPDLALLLRSCIEEEGLLGCQRPVEDDEEEEY